MAAAQPAISKTTSSSSKDPAPATSTSEPRTAKEKIADDHINADFLVDSMLPEDQQKGAMAAALKTGVNAVVNTGYDAAMGGDAHARYNQHILKDQERASQLKSTEQIAAARAAADETGMTVEAQASELMNRHSLQEQENQNKMAAAELQRDQFDSDEAYAQAQLKLKVDESRATQVKMRRQDSLNLEEARQKNKREHDIQSEQLFIKADDKKHKIDMGIYSNLLDPDGDGGEIFTDEYKHSRQTFLKGMLLERIGDYESQKFEMQSRLKQIATQKEILDLKSKQLDKEMDMEVIKEANQQKVLDAEENIARQKASAQAAKEIADVKTRAEQAYKFQASEEAVALSLWQKKQVAESEAESARRRTQATIDSKKYDMALHATRTNIRSQTKITNARVTMKSEVEKALGIRDQDMQAVKGLMFQLRVAKILSLVQILGCELDLYGYFLAYFTYWRAGEECHEQGHQDVCHQSHPDQIWLMHWMLRIGPFGYMVATLLYMYWDQIEAYLTEMFGEMRTEVGLAKALLSDTDPEKAQFTTAQRVRMRFVPELGDDKVTKDYFTNFNLMDENMTCELVTIRYFHIVPILRYVLLIKNPEACDVEALFRVNALSTFTLGFAQISCMVIGLSTSPPMMSWDIMIKIGQFAQVVNFAMTIIYFFTSYPELMKSSMRLDAILYTKQQAMAAESNRFQYACDQYTMNFGKEIPDLDLGEFSKKMKESDMEMLKECREQSRLDRLEREREKQHQEKGDGDEAVPEGADSDTLSLLSGSSGTATVASRREIFERPSRLLKVPEEASVKRRDADVDTKELSSEGHVDLAKKGEYSDQQQRLLDEVRFFRCRAMRDINQLARLHIDLSPFPTVQLFEWRKKLQLKEIAISGATAGL